MLLVLLLLLLLLKYVRVTGRRYSQCSTVEEEITHLLVAVGFQVMYGVLSASWREFCGLSARRDHFYQVKTATTYFSMSRQEACYMIHSMLQAFLVLMLLDYQI